MAKSSNLNFSVFLFIITKTALAHTCSNYKFSSNTLFHSCNDLPVLDSFLHYTYDSSSGNLQIAYRHTNLTSKKWVSWAVNPTSTSMVGAQAIVAYQQPDGSVRAYTSPISSYQTSLQEGDLSFNVSELSATYQNNEMVIFATLNLPLGNGGNINTLWQDGSLSGNSLLPHLTSGSNIRSVSTLNLLSGASGGGAGDSKLKKRNIQYQSSSYIIGVAGWATGLKLGEEPAWIQFSNHRSIGIALFCLATVESTSNHPSNGERFEGSNILSPEKQWRTAYTTIIITLSLVAAVLEAFTWYVVPKRRKTEESAKTSQLGIKQRNTHRDGW